MAQSIQSAGSPIGIIPRLNEVQVLPTVRPAQIGGALTIASSPAWRIGATESPLATAIEGAVEGYKTAKTLEARQKALEIDQKKADAEELHRKEQAQHQKATLEETIRANKAKEANDRLKHSMDGVGTKLTEWAPQGDQLGLPQGSSEGTTSLFVSPTPEAEFPAKTEAAKPAAAPASPLGEVTQPPAEISGADLSDSAALISGTTMGLKALPPVVPKTAASVPAATPLPPVKAAETAPAPEAEIPAPASAPISAAPVKPSTGQDPDLTVDAAIPAFVRPGGEVVSPEIKIVAPKKTTRYASWADVPKERAAQMTAFKARIDAARKANENRPFSSSTASRIADEYNQLFPDSPEVADVDRFNVGKDGQQLRAGDVKFVDRGPRTEAEIRAREALELKARNANGNELRKAGQAFRNDRVVRLAVDRSDAMRRAFAAARELDHGTKAPEIADQELADSFIQFATGKSPTVSQFDFMMKEASRGLPREVKLKVQKYVRGGVLDPIARDGILNQMADTWNITIPPINDVIDRHRAILKGKDYVPQELIPERAPLVEQVPRLQEQFAELAKQQQTLKAEYQKATSQERKQAIQQQALALKAKGQEIQDKIQRSQHGIHMEDFANQPYWGFNPSLVILK